VTALAAGSTAWSKLQASVEQLKELVDQKRGAPSIELERLTGHIQSLLSKWKR